MRNHGIQIQDLLSSEAGQNWDWGEDQLHVVQSQLIPPNLRQMVLLQPSCSILNKNVVTRSNNPGY